MYLTVVAMASLLVMAFNLNSNMNSNMNAYASIFSDIKNADDIGQSLECVIVVVGCDGNGSVGSSGDVNVGSNNGNDDNNTNGNGNGETPLPPIDPTVCETCLETLTTDQLLALKIALGLTGEATLAEVCLAIDALGTIAALDAGLVRYRRGVPMERPTARDEGHVHEVRVLGAAVVLHGELDDGVALIVEQSLQTLHLSLGMAANVIRHLEVLALDDRPHPGPPEAPPARLTTDCGTDDARAEHANRIARRDRV